MKSAKLLFACCLFNLSSAHYVFSYLIANGTIYDQWKYVRHVTPNTTGALGLHAYPHYDLTSPNIRCGRDATKSGPQSDIATIVAGQEIGFRIDFWNAPYVMFHDGPLQAYLSRSPTQTREGLKYYEGEGDWFKVASRGPFNRSQWFENYNQRFSEFNFTVPETTPPGLYLLRPESVYPMTQFNRTQFYMNCAQVEIVGPGNPKTDPGPMVKFPGAYDDFDEGIWISEEVRKDLSKYKAPGPDVWKG